MAGACNDGPGGTASPRPRDVNGDTMYREVIDNRREDVGLFVLPIHRMTCIVGNGRIKGSSIFPSGRIDFADIVWILTHL